MNCLYCNPPLIPVDAPPRGQMMIIPLTPEAQARQMAWGDLLFAASKAERLKALTTLYGVQRALEIMAGETFSWVERST